MHLAETCDCSSMNGFPPIKKVGFWPTLVVLATPVFCVLKDKSQPWDLRIHLLTRPGADRGEKHVARESRTPNVAEEAVYTWVPAEES